MSYSQIGQDDYYINNISNHKRNGIFLDIGANDGIYTSNTAKLEFEYGWTGVCVEANINLIDKLQKNRPNSIIVNSAVWSKKSKVNFEIPNNNYKNIDGHLLSRISGIAGNENNFKHHFKDNVNIIELEADSITSILEKNFKIPCDIDYMSLDVEGAELEVLKGIDFNKINIRFMTIEHGDRKNYKESIIDFLTQHNYVLHRINKWDIEFIK